MYIEKGLRSFSSIHEKRVQKQKCAFIILFCIYIYIYIILVNLYNKMSIVNIG